MQEEGPTARSQSRGRAEHFSGLWLARNEGMDPNSSPYITIIVVSIFVSIPSFPAKQMPVFSALLQLPKSSAPSKPQKAMGMACRGKCVV